MKEISSLSFRDWTTHNHLDTRELAISLGIPYNTIRGYLLWKIPGEGNKKILFERTWLSCFSPKEAKIESKLKEKSIDWNENKTINLNLLLKEWFDKQDYTSIADFSREAWISQKTVSPWFLGKKIWEKHRMKLYLITNLEEFADTNYQTIDVENIKKVWQNIDNLVSLMYFFQNSTPENREALKQTLESRGQSIGYIYNLLRLMFDEKKFQEWKKNYELLNNN